MSAVLAESPAAVRAWVSRFESALASPATADWSTVFADECYWRDFLAFTWNIITLEGREAIASMVRTQAGAIAATGFALDAPSLPMTDDAQGWFTFRTATSRCRGHVQLKDGRAYVLLTAAVALIEHEESGGPRRPDGIEHRAEKKRRTWLDDRRQDRAGAGPQRAALLPHRRRRSERLDAGGTPETPGRADARRRCLGEARGRLAQSLSFALPARSDLPRSLPLPAVSRSLAALHVQGQDRRLARDLRQGDGDRLLGEHALHGGAIRREDRRMDGHRHAWRRDADAAAEAAGARDGPLRLQVRAGHPRRGALRGQAIPLGGSWRRRGPRRQACHRHRIQQLRPRHLRGPVGARRGRHDDPALADDGRPRGHDAGASPRISTTRSPAPTSTSRT